MLLTPLAPAATPEGSQPEVPAQQAQTGLGSVLGALQRRVRRLQRCQEQHQAQLQALERLAQQLHGESLLARACRGLQRLVSGTPAWQSHPWVLAWPAVCFHFV